MNTPIVDFVRAYAESNTARLHMPGHKGKAALGLESHDMGRLFRSVAALDITEIAGADDLFDAEGIIAESERNAAALFGAGKTLYSTEGATLPIKAMLALVAQKARKAGTRVRILAARNAHKSFLYGCALLDIDVDWMYGASGHLCECRISEETLNAALSSTATPYCAVYVTSPDYLGNTLDIAALAAVCRAHGVPLLVDNAHGAYLAFTAPVCHPIALGATMCADSAHKTLPALTGAAYLHIAKDADPYFAQNAKQAMALFASTSPSYLILQSLDLCNPYLESGFRDDLTACTLRVSTLKEQLAAAGYTLLGNEPMKLTVDGHARGYGGAALADALRENGVEPEFTDRDCVVLMCSPQNTSEELARITQALLALPVREKIAKITPVMPHSAKKACSIREAILAPAVCVAVEDAPGRICAAPAVSCPPAIPITVSGEVVDEHAVALFKAYGIDSIRVVE